MEDFLTALGCPLDHVTVYRDVQEVGKNARGMREEWLKRARRVKVVGGDPARVRCSGEGYDMSVLFGGGTS